MNFKKKDLEFLIYIMILILPQVKLLIELKSYKKSNLNIKQISWCGDNQDIILILTKENSLYKISNIDSNIEDLDQKLFEKGKQKLKENELIKEV